MLRSKVISVPPRPLTVSPGIRHRAERSSRSQGFRGESTQPRKGCCAVERSAEVFPSAGTLEDLDFGIVPLWHTTAHFLYNSVVLVIVVSVLWHWFVYRIK